MRIAIIGSGISGIAAAHVLSRFGHGVTIFERSAEIGGIWALTYPGVRLQNVAEHYRLADFPWPFEPDLHPTGAQVLAYIKAVVSHFALDVRVRHEVTSLVEEGGGWRLELRSPQGEAVEHFDYVVVAVGQYSADSAAIALPGIENFAGQVLNEREVRDLDIFEKKRVAVVGFGKTAVDMASFAVARGASVHHVFREARWLLPRTIFGAHMSKVVPTRFATIIAPSWVHPSWSGAILHRYFGFLVWYYWKVSEVMFRAIMGLHPFHFDPKARARMRLLTPRQRLTYQLRAAIALAPDGYYAAAARGDIEPCRGSAVGFDQDALLLADGRRIKADIVVFAIGQQPPDFPFLPERYRRMMTCDEGGTQLYRHIVHPGIPKLAFAGFNHSFMHVQAVELAMVWLGAHLRGDLMLRSAEEMSATSARVAAWKQKHTLFEPTQAHGIGGRFHQYFDVLLTDIGVRPQRKAGAIRDWFDPYTAVDYATVFEDYELAQLGRTTPRLPAPFDT